jgi:hypothetical protein
MTSDSITAERKANQGVPALAGSVQPTAETAGRNPRTR